MRCLLFNGRDRGLPAGGLRLPQKACNVGFPALHRQAERRFAFTGGVHIGALGEQQQVFGNLYGMDVYAAESLTENDQIAFNAGSHTEVIKMAYKDFERLVRPRVVSFTT